MIDIHCQHSPTGRHLFRHYHNLNFASDTFGAKGYVCFYAGCHQSISEAEGHRLLNAAMLFTADTARRLAQKGVETEGQIASLLDYADAWEESE